MDPRLSILPTPFAGNGVFATAPIQAHTLLLTTQSPSFSVIYRPYRKESCGFCFKYNLGRNWKIRSTGPATGFVFCSEFCRDAWEADVGRLGREAYEKVEELMRRFKGPQVVVGEGYESPTEEAIVQAWKEAEVVAAGILEMRMREKIRGALETKMTKPRAIDPDTLAFVLSGVLALHDARDAKGSALDILYEAPVPYTLVQDLAAHVNSYLQLLELLPIELLDLVTPRNVQRIAGLAYDNAFGIRSVDHAVTALGVDEDPGSELLGWALYPEASLFNHSCLPNVKKAREGRVWKFWSSRDIEAGEQMCITYLGGDERSLGREGRQERLRLGWEFECACQGCVVPQVGRPVVER